MFEYSRRGSLVWLLIVGIVLGIALAAGDVPPLMGAALLAGYLGLASVVMRYAQVRTWLQALSAMRRRPDQITEVAREAASRARSHPAYDPLIDLLDIGLIVDEQRPDGLSLRRGRFISLDDEGARPFAIIHVPDTLAERLGRIRFEMRDESGQVRYVWESEEWLRRGENALLPNYRLPLRHNTTSLEAGRWAVRVLVDDRLLGIHHFNLSPPLSARRRQIAADGEMHERVWRTSQEDESLPLSLEELLRQQSRERRQA